MYPASNPDAAFSRVKTDDQLASFFAGVQARSFRELSLAAGATPGGTWAESLPVIPKNEMSVRPAPLYVPQSHLEAGGTFSGGTLYDVIHVKTAGGTGHQSTVGGNRDDVLGAPAGTGFYKFSNPGSGTATGIFTIAWDELPAS